MTDEQAKQDHAAAATPRRIAGKDMADSGERELTRQLKALTQQIGALAAMNAQRGGSENITQRHVHQAMQQFAVSTTPTWRAVLESVVVFLLGAVISTIIQCIATAQVVSIGGWIALGLAALILAPVAAVLVFRRLSAS